MPHWLLLKAADSSLSSEYKLAKFYHHVAKTFAFHLEGSDILRKRTGQANQDLQTQGQKVKLLSKSACFLKC